MQITNETTHNISLPIGIEGKGKDKRVKHLEIAPGETVSNTEIKADNPQLVANVTVGALSVESAAVDKAVQASAERSVKAPGVSELK